MGDSLCRQDTVMVGNQWVLRTSLAFETEGCPHIEKMETLIYAPLNLAQVEHAS